MNRRDYLEWVNYHTACLTSCGGWFEKQHDADSVHSAWQKALATVSLEDACAATDAIVAGSLERPFPEETAAVVRRFSAELALSRRESKPEPDGHGRMCELCRGTGHVTIWHPLIARAVAQGCTMFRAPNGSIFRAVDEFGEVKAVTAVAPCNCSLGDRFASRSVKRGDHYEREEVRRYSPSHFHCRMQFRTQEERKAMSVREQVEADLEAAGVHANGLVEWEY